MTVHFDTLEFVKTPTSAGVTPPHAEAIARAHAKSMGDLVDNELATKADLQVLRTELKAEMQTLRAEVGAEIGTLRAETKAANETLRAEMKSESQTLRAELKADFQTELRSLKYGASIAMGLLSLIVVLTRFIR